MKKHPNLRSLIPAAGLLALASWTSVATAGHLNIVLEAELDGREEVAANATDRRIVGDPRARGKAYVFGVDGDPRTLCYLIVDVKKLAEIKQPPGGGRAAHIHEAPRGVIGPIVANLAWPQDGQASDCLTEGETDPNGPKFPNEQPGIVQRILNNPENFYVNVHNSVFPAGAIRGQLFDPKKEKEEDKKMKKEKD